jgi:transcription antitermination factor NusG
MNALSIEARDQPVTIPDFRWYVVRLRSNFEQTACQILIEKGYSTFLPLYRSRRKWSDRTKEIDIPLFPGYLFCKFDPPHKLPIVMTAGVVSILESSEGPIPVDESEIASVRALLKSGLPFGPWPFLREGQPVLVERGPLMGVEGRIISLKNKYQLVVSVSLLQRSVSVEIDRECVRPLAQRSSAARVQ